MEHFEGILDHYAVLGLEQGCSPADIRKAFRAKALRWHPDKAGTGAEAKRRFQEAADAYEVLGDEEKKKAYDFQLQQTARQQAESQQAEKARASPPKPPQSSPHTQKSPEYANYAKPESRKPPHGYAGYPNYPGYPFPKPAYATHRDTRPTYAEVHGHRQPRPDAEAGATCETREVRPSVHDPRPTAAELNPQGFGPPFRATVSDLTTLASFTHEGAVWVPKVRDVKWCRPGDGARVQLSFVADYTSSRSRVNRGSRLLQLLQISSCDALQTSFQEHLDRVAGKSWIDIYGACLAKDFCWLEIPITD